MKFELLDQKDGLSNHALTHIAIDSSGFIWIATQDGLNRYDGNNVKVFRHSDSDSTSLLYDNGQRLYVDPNGKIWISYYSGGISLYKEDCQCFQHFKYIDYNGKNILKSVNILYISKSGELWFSNWGLGLNSYQPSTGKLRHIDLTDIHPKYSSDFAFNYNGVNTIYVADTGNFWLATMNGLYHFDPVRFTLTYKRMGNPNPNEIRYDCFNHIIPDGQDGLWMSAWGGGICHFKFQDESFKTYLFSSVKPLEGYGNIAYYISYKSEKELWLASEDRSIGVFNIKSKTFEFIQNHQIPESEDTPPGIFQVKNIPGNTTIFGSTIGLLVNYPYSSLFNFKYLDLKKSQNFKNFIITKITADSLNHAVYFATEAGAGLIVKDTRSGKLSSHAVEIRPSKKDKITKVFDFTIDPNGTMWVLSEDYMYEFDRVKRKLIRVPEPWPKGEEDSNFKSIHKDRNGELWMTSIQGGLHSFNPRTKKISDRINSDKNGNSYPKFAERICFDLKNRIWIQSDKEIWYYDRNENSFTPTLSSEQMNYTQKGIRGFIADSFGNIWVAVRQKGLLKISYNEKAQLEFEWKGESDGINFNKLFVMDSDPEGNIWASCLTHILYLNTTTNDYRIFDHEMGMHRNTIRTVFLKGEESDFYISSYGTYCEVNLKKLELPLSSPKVYIDKYNVLNEKRTGIIGENSIVQIAHNEIFFSFDFGCVNITNQSNYQFAYKLEGWDKDWVKCGSRRFANFTNLDGGKYTFKVRASNREGIWSEEVSVPVIIETPFYKKYWFLVLLIFALATLIYGLYKFRISQIERTEQIKTEFNRQLSETRLQALRAQMNPHFIFNCLNSINRYIIKSDIKTSSLYLTRFAKLIRLILDNSEHKTVKLSNEVEALKLYIDMESLRFDHKFSFEVTMDPNLESDQIEIPPLLIQPFVENAIWHGLLHKDSGGHLSVKISQGHENLICEVTDNGIGRKKAMEYKSQTSPTRSSIGMKLTEERLNITATEIDKIGSFKIIDLEDKNGKACGTKVIIKIPL
ncbi:MAG: histidine kinase [Saprospiraceae bacterium]|nr:histidine kinase [Saprospiraceae bacterium]